MAWYKTGTAGVTNGSPVVNLTGADLISNNVQVGWAFVGPDGRAYEITGIASATQLTINPAYASSTGAGYAYACMPTSSLTANLVTAVNSLTTSYQAVRDGVGQGLFPDGSVAAPGFRFAADQDTGWFRSGTNGMGISVGGVMAANFAQSGISLLTSSFYSTSFKLGAGGNGSGNRGFILDLIGDDTYTDYGLRLQRDPAGPNGTTYLAARGTGAFNCFLPDAGSFVWSTSGIGRWTISGPGWFAPVQDNALPIGLASNRVSVIYLGSSPVVSSDERIKTWRGGLTDAELAAAKEIAAAIGIYQLNLAVAAKGANGARWHTGVKAQEVVSILTAHGLTPARYAFYCYDEWAATPAVPAQDEARDKDGTLLRMAISAQEARPAGNLLQIRYDELAMFLAAAQEQRLLALEAKLAA